MASWVIITTCLLLCCYGRLTHAKASEYQLEEDGLTSCELLRQRAGPQDHAPHCTQDGRFRHVQCSGEGVTCWCVNSQGQEIPGTRTNNSVPHCVSFCRQQRQAVLSQGSGSIPVAALPECQRSGEFSAVQCDGAAGQCWCVDLDGMELYGTRQNGRPANCPGSCEVRARRFLHTNRGRSPPQCSEDGGFLPVQCKFINTTDATELDLSNSFNRFPEAFETFSNFRRAFPSVSSYCYCSDSRGREMANTGVELLLSEVYDTAFRGVSSGPSFSQTNIYRVLQRRLLALRLALTGLFRCPTACEDQRRAAEQVSSAYVPQCESSSGLYSPRQCPLQAGGQCWCVEPATGTELPGSRQHGDSVVCDAGAVSCPAQRREALSRLFSGPVEPPSRTSSELPDSSSSSCTELLQPVRELLGGGAEVAPFVVTRLSEVLHGLFPSVGLALEALARSSTASPQRLQENLFGGKVLKNAAALNFSGTVGERGALLSQLAVTSGVDRKENSQLVLLLSRTLESPAFLHALRRSLLALRSSPHASLEEVLTPLLRSCSGVGGDAPQAAAFVPSCAPGGLYQEVQCDGAQCWCVDPLTGREVAASRTAGRHSRPARCPTRCEAERARALREKSTMAAGAELHVPACSAEDGGFLPLQCAGGGARCFCVDAAGSRTTALAAGGALTCPASTQTLQNRPALCSEALAEVTAFRQEAETIVFLSNSSRLPLAYAFLLAEGLRLTEEELLLASQSAEVRMFDTLLLNRSRSALQLATYSTLQWYWRRDASGAESHERPAGYQPYTPQCDQRGDWLSTQCHRSTGQCWCVDEDGQYIPDSLTSRSKTLPRCLSRCQRRRVHTLLSGWLKGSDIISDGHSTGYSARCEESGQFSVLQTEGAAGWCVNPLTGEVLQAATLDPAGRFTCPSWCELQGALCQPDGSFAPLQCDVASCWCVSEDGQEVGGTRRRASANAPMSCDRPACPRPAITHGALLCSAPTGGRQSCDLVCHRGYRNALPVGSFLCTLEDQRWDANSPPLSGACQRSQAYQTVRSTAELSLSVDDHQSCSSISSNLTAPLINAVCSLKLPVSGARVTVCDDSSVRVQCGGDGDVIRLKVTWAASLSDLPTPGLPDLHDVGVFLNGSRLLAALQGLLGNLLPSLTSEPRLVSATTPSFGCSPGYRLQDTDGAGCVVCPAGTFSAEEACLLCPEGTYQDEEGRDSCRKCPRGSSAIGASSASQCVTSCQRRGLRCSESGDFLPAQPDVQSGGWRCVSAQGDDLVWTNSNEPLSDEQCTVLSRFEAVPGSDLITGAEDADILSTLNTDLVACVQACATEPSCHHVAVFTEEEQRRCQLYSTHTLNTHCNASTQASGFLGNPETELFDWLSCSPRVSGGASDLLVVRKRGEEFAVTQHQQRTYERMRMTKALSGVFRTLAFSSSSSSTTASARGGTSVTDVHRFCQEQCSRDTCCRGFVINRNVLDGGSVLCGLMGAPSVLQCADEDWDVSGRGAAERVCGAGLTYDPQHRSFVFNLAGHDFTITDAALPADSKDKKDYQASIVTFQAIYLHNGSEPAADVTSPSCTGTQQTIFVVDAAVQSGFESLDESRVLVDPKRSLPALSYWLNKMNFNSQQALLWCLSRCLSEQQCSIVDVRQEDAAGFHSCLLYPDSTLCGAYDKPLRQPCRPLLPRAPHSAHIKKVDLSGPVKSFYTRVPFQKMVSYSVRSRVSLGDTPLSQGFLECERRCDEDPCCRGMGFVRDTKSSAGGDVACLSLISLGVQTCSEEDDSATTWTTQDCRPSAVRARPEPFGWYLKPVNQWSKSPALCPPFTLPAPKNNVSVDQWSVVEDSRVTVDPALSAYDVIHVSRDIAGDVDKTRDWCLHACESVDSCKVVTISQTHSATRCVLYPDTTSCVPPSPAPKASSPASTQQCRLVVREPASRVYLRNERLPLVTSVAIPGHGTLRGVAATTSLGGDRKTVVRYLGVPYARPPIGSLRFRPPRPANWTGSWDASKARPSCIQPGDLQSSASSEDCLYLNIFVPVGPVSGPVPVLVFFFNPSANQSPGLLDGSTLSAVGNIVVVTANYRTAALGFVSTGTEELAGNYGLADQEAALRWVKGHASLFGGDGARVTVGAERAGADIASLLLRPSPSSRPALFSRMILMGGSVFSPAGVQSVSSSRQQAVQLAAELGCVASDDLGMAACLRQTAAHTLNAAQTKLLAVSGPLQAWSPVVDGVTVSSVRPLAVQTPDLLLGSSAQDGLIGRARRIKDFEVLQGRLDGKTAFYEALSRSLGGEEQGSGPVKEAGSGPVKEAGGEEQGSGPVKEAASWLYGLQHSPSPAGYNLFSVALNDATRDMFIVCPSVQMASHWAKSRANAFLYHLPESTAQTSADASTPLDVQLVFGTPLQPISSQRFTSTEKRLSLAMMTYFSNFVKTGDPNQAQVSSRAPPAPGLPLWSAVPPPPAPPLYKEVEPELRQLQGLRQQQCSFWNDLAPKLTSSTQTAELGAEPVQPIVTPPTLPSSQSQTEKDAYN